MQHKFSKGLSIFFILVMALLSLGGCIYVTSPTPGPSQPAPAPAPTPPAVPINPGWMPPPSGSAATIALPSIADVVAAVKPSVVAINTEVVTLDFFNRPFTQKGAGSGWIIDSNGIIVTNNHVVEDTRTITVTLDDGRTFNADPGKVFTDPLNDLAILQIDAQDLPAVKIGDSTRLRVGDWVVTIGNSLGLGISAKQGIVSRLNVSIPIDQGQTLYELIETSAAINPGNSGGPLVNMTAEVIGITSAKISSAGVEGMGYAISVHTAVPTIEALIKNGYVVRPWLGVVLYTVDQFAVMRYSLAVEEGVLVTGVAGNSPAEKAGLKAGDVITAANDKDVATSDELIRVIHSVGIGNPVKITFWRGKENLTTEVITAETPPPS